jgi:hypothetical protein
VTRRDEKNVECKGKNKLYLSRFEKKEEEEEEQVKSSKKGSKCLVLNKLLTINSGYSKIKGDVFGIYFLHTLSKLRQYQQHDDNNLMQLGLQIFKVLSSYMMIYLK